MKERLLDDDWYRIAKLRPYLRSSVQVGRHRYRGSIWYVLHEPGSGANLRIDRAGYELVSRLDGYRSVDRVWKELLALRKDQAPSQTEIIRTISKFHDVGLLHADALGNASQMHRRAGKTARQKILNRVNPLSFQLGLFDPSAVLDRLAPIVRPLFSRYGALAWVALVLGGLMLAILNIDELGARTARAWQDPGFLLIMWLVYPVLKALHELAHALAVRRLGGDVHEMGLRMLVLMPVPYVDASASSLFSDKRRRIFVAAAGIACELALAGLAMLIWTQVRDGTVREIALATVLIGSVSTLLFNANPLLRFDGYFVLSDWLELPNLASRAREYWTHLARRHLLRIRDDRSPIVDAGERGWLLGYGFFAWLYRMFVFAAIAVLIAQYHSLAGLAVLLFGLWTGIVAPLLKSVRFIAKAPGLTGRRVQAAVVASAIASAMLVAVLFVPIPATTVANGVVWLPEDAVVRARTDGFVQTIDVTDGELVRAGQRLLVLRNDELIARQTELNAKLRALQTERFAYFEHDAHKLVQLDDQITQMAADLDRVDQDIDALEIRAGVSGRVVMPHAADRIGGFLDKGAVVGHVLGTHDAMVRIVLSNDDAPLVRERTNDIRVQLADSRGIDRHARLKNEIPGATERLPSVALGTAGGGSTAIDPADPKFLKTMQPVFVVDVELPATQVRRAGGHAWVRFDHGNRSIAEHAMRASRKLLLRHFEG